ncbi:hypothetical protein [Gryllotalpicola sp.]|uniref:PH-like domain-containing protein n=1 Tax=Gryllotalpicola sp. TaxID=1932787 RepID=UPI00262B4ECD|nr:hypothetical protein [Gryllotalpicola sp.]
MDKTWPTLIVIAILLLVFFGMWWGWRSRQKRSAHLIPPTSAPDHPGAELVSAPLFYVATTEHGKPLERLAIRGLGFRARAQLIAYEAGAELSIPGERAVFIAASAITDVAPATVTIDKVVEKNGLIRVSWIIDGTIVDSYLRVIGTDPEPVFRALASYTAAPSTTTSTPQSEV